MKFTVFGQKELDVKLSRLITQIDTTVELKFNLSLEKLIESIKRRISNETGPNAPLYKKAKEAVFGPKAPYEVTGSVIKNIQSVKLPGNSKEKRWSFGVQPIQENTYSINLIFEMFRTGKRGLAPDINKLSTEIASDLEKNFPNFKYFYKFFSADEGKVRELLRIRLTEIIEVIIHQIFKK